MIKKADKVLEKLKVTVQLIMGKFNITRDEVRTCMSGLIFQLI